MKRTLVLIAACMAVIFSFGNKAEVYGQLCCIDGYKSESVYQLVNGKCLKNEYTQSCNRVDECNPNCSQENARSCVINGHIWKGNPDCECETGCGSAVLYCRDQGRDTDPNTCQCTGICAAFAVTACLATDGVMDYGTCKCHHSDPCDYPVAYPSYGYSINCVDCGLSCNISTGDPLIVNFYGKNNQCCWTQVFYTFPGDEMCYVTSTCAFLCGYYGC